MTSTPESSTGLDIRSVLATDCGSTTTKAILIEKVGGEYRQTWRGDVKIRSAVITMTTTITGANRADSCGAWQIVQML